MALEGAGAQQARGPAGWVADRGWGWGWRKPLGLGGRLGRRWAGGCERAPELRAPRYKNPTHVLSAIANETRICFRFLKGLTVVDDVAYFGISEWAPRDARDDPRSNCQLAAFDLVHSKLLWRREVRGGRR